MTEEEARVLLDVHQETLSSSVLDKALKKAQCRYHPDKEGGSHEQFVRLEKAHEKLVASIICSKYNITIPDFNDPDVIKEYKRIEERGKHGDEVSRILYAVLQSFPGVGWPPVWPPIEDSDGGATPVGREAGVEEAAPKQEKKQKRALKDIENYNYPGKHNEVSGKRKRCAKQPREDQEERDKLPRAPKTNVCPVCQKLKGRGRPTKNQWYCPECSRIHTNQ